MIDRFVIFVRNIILKTHIKFEKNCLKLCIFHLITIELQQFYFIFSNIISITFLI